MTASPMSAVASRAASNGRIFFSSTKRKMFSSTTMASSMTMPTMSTRASMVTLLRVKFERPHHAEGGDDRARDGHRGDDGRAQAPHEGQHHQRGQDAAQHQVQVDLVQGVVDVLRLIADDLGLDVGGQPRGQAGQVGLDRLDDGHRVLAGLPAHLQDHARHAVDAGGRALLLGAVLGRPDVADADGRAAHGGHHQVVERLGVDDAPHGAQRLLAEPGRHVAPGQVGVLPDHGVAHRGDGDLVGGQPVGVDPHVDGAGEPADQPHLAHPGRALDVELHRAARRSPSARAGSGCRRRPR